MHFTRVNLFSEGNLTRYNHRNGPIRFRDLEEENGNSNGNGLPNTKILNESITVPRSGIEVLTSFGHDPLAQTAQIETQNALTASQVI